MSFACNWTFNQIRRNYWVSESEERHKVIEYSSEFEMKLKKTKCFLKAIV